jgi:hypothetical protein
VSRFIAPHPGSQETSPSSDASYMLMHPVYSKEYLESIHPRHKKPEKVRIPLAVHVCCGPNIYKL